MNRPQRLRNANHRRVRAPKFNKSFEPTATVMPSQRLGVAAQLQRSPPAGRQSAIMCTRIMMKYKVALRHSDEGYSVSCPGLPGCWSQGETEDEALANIRIAIQEYLAAIEESLQQSDVREVEVFA